MKRWLPVLLVLLLGGGVYLWRGRPTPTRLDERPTSSLSDQEKARLQEFWKSFREAETLRRQGQWESALPVYRAALDLDPDHERALYHFANCLIELDRYQEALEPLQHLVEVAPLSQRGHLQIGLVRSCPSAAEAFDLDSAERALRRAVKINQEETGALLRLAGVLLVKGDLEQAAELYTLANQSNFRAVEGYYLRAYVDWLNDRSASARELLQEAVRQLGQPEVVAGVPGEGDTRNGDQLPPSTIEAKRLIRPFWSGLDERLTDQTELHAEFAPLAAWLSRLREL